MNGVALHLARRFFGSLSRAEPASEDETWARSNLLPGEQAVWGRMPAADRRHATGVARTVAADLGPDATRPVLAAALLHDSGKVVSGYGTFARVLATLVGLVRGRDAPAGRMGDYLRHSDHGARLLADAGSDPLTIAWTREHHLPPDRWTLEPRLTRALSAADDD